MMTCKKFSKKHMLKLKKTVLLKNLKKLSISKEIEFQNNLLRNFAVLTAQPLRVISMILTNHQMEMKERHRPKKPKKLLHMHQKRKLLTMILIEELNAYKILSVSVILVRRLKS